MNILEVHTATIEVANFVNIRPKIIEYNKLLHHCCLLETTTKR